MSHKALIERLRQLANSKNAYPLGEYWNGFEEAADAIESLLAEVERGRKDAEKKHRLIIHHHSDARELWKALNDLSFECDGVTQTQAPSRETYNRTFLVMKKHRQGYSDEARSVDAALTAASKEGGWEMDGYTAVPVTITERGEG